MRPTLAHGMFCVASRNGTCLENDTMGFLPAARKSQELQDIAC